MTTTPPPPPGGHQSPDEPYDQNADPHAQGGGPPRPPDPTGDRPAEPPRSEGYPSQPAQGGQYPPPQPPHPPQEPYPAQGGDYPQQGATYQPPPPAQDPHSQPPQSGAYGDTQSGHYGQGGTYGPPSGSYGNDQGGYQAQEPYTPPPSGGYAPPPAAGGGGGGYPPSPPDGPYWPPEPGQGGPDPYDPIVATDFNTWFNRVMGVFQRSWKSIGLIMLVGAVIPSLVVGTVNTAVGPVGDDMSTIEWSDYAGSGLWSLLAWIITGFLAAAAVVAAMRVAVREGTPGVQVPFGESMSYGFGRALPMWGWTIIASIVITIGLCACILPGIYLAIALALIAPAFVFEGGNPFVRSFKLTHSDFGRALSRLLVAFLAFLVYGCIISIPLGLIEGAVAENGLSFGGFIVVLILEAIRAVLLLPVAIAAVAVILVTYAELRSRKEGLSTRQLVSEADAAGGRLPGFSVEEAPRCSPTGGLFPAWSRAPSGHSRARKCTVRSRSVKPSEALTARMAPFTSAL
ncbi:hypothetical protein AB0I28_28875 [Phytomonospora sp. NPDC050363]|uniref:hypothetical protein n=1 Tax=Phytomonospora sp. NPDC050363 TaxID=3155642 RepID=UPI0033E3EA2B